ncbi:outer membrane protein [Celeribacter sp.]|uniref:outer membrane protein n=1 Tax=Celeribacter sp. TaxID=1890673 RepID=UPI003A8EADE2
MGQTFRQARYTGLVVGVLLGLQPAAVLAQPAWDGWYGGAVIAKSQSDGQFTPLGSAPYGTADSNPAIGGAFVGYAFQKDSFVWGVEASYMTGLGSGGSFAHGAGSSSMDISTDSVASLGLRGGVAQGSALFFASAGVARMDMQLDVNVFSPADTITFHDGVTTSYVGIGVAYQIDTGWFAQLEARHYNDFSASNPSMGFPNTTTTISPGTHHYTFDTVSLGIGLQF